MSRGMPRACSSTSGGNSCGRWCLRMMISTSTPKSSGYPRISITRPTPCSPSSGNSRISTFTIMPSRSSTDLICARRHAHAVGEVRRARNLHALRNLDPLLNALVGRNHEVAALADAELADHGHVRAAQNADDFAFGPAVAAQCA